MTLGTQHTRENHCAYVAIATDAGAAVVTACAEERGHGARHVTEHATYDEAAIAAEGMNVAADISPAYAAAVKLCSMFRPGDFSEVYADLI